MISGPTDTVESLKPLFVYGTLMPGEMAYAQIADYVLRYENAKLLGYELLVRDLMPLVDKTGATDFVQGYILTPKPETSAEFYEKLILFEGSNFEITDSLCETENLVQIEVLVFVGVETNYGRPEKFKGPQWSTRLDPLLSKSFPVLIQDIQETLQYQFPSFNEQENIWKLKNRKISNYLLLSSILEHIWSLTHGALFAGEKGEINNLLKSMANSSSYKSAYKAASNLHLIPYVSISDSRDVRKGPISTAKSSGALRTWYRIRGNSLHRGKSGSDTEIVEDASIGLGNLLLLYLDAEIPGIREEWNKEVQNLQPIIR
jgi:gamma-glutamylcyclotransferase (GGCT)/AIG2-like uncharacterized protein YtfP